jgi:hypothetical protein
MTDYSELSDMPARSAQRKLIEQHDALEAQAKLIEKLEANAAFWQKDALHMLKVKNEGDARVAELEQMVAVLMRHEARDYTIKVQKARIAELEKREKHLEEMFHGWRDEAMKKDARIAELEVALKPFIEELVAAEAEYDELDDDELVYVFKITYGDLRAARAALKEEK